MCLSSLSCKINAAELLSVTVSMLCPACWSMCCVTGQLRFHCTVLYCIVIHCTKVECTALFCTAGCRRIYRVQALKAELEIMAPRNEGEGDGSRTELQGFRRG
jgi:hypothetical protein